LSALAAKVVALRKVDGRLDVRAVSQKGELRLTADVVVNCLGTGAWLPNTHSMLIRNLTAKRDICRLTAQGCGFVIRPDTFEVDGADGCFLIGPLLNQGPPETQVENILAVYRVADVLAKTLYRRLRSATL
jgi:hypothetical protein